MYERTMDDRTVAASLSLRYNLFGMNTQAKSPTSPDKDYRIFFIFMTIVLVGMAIWSLVSNPDLHTPWRGGLFGGLMLVHVWLHWNVVRIISVPGRTPLYILGQGLLAFVLVYLSGNEGMIYSLFMALIGETIGFLGISRWGVLTTLYYLGLSLLNFVLFFNAQNAIFWLLVTIPTVFFVGMYVTMYLRQVDAREQAQFLAAELEAANRQLAAYVTQVEDLTIANERQRMARELHDTLSQGLAGIILQLEATDAHLAGSRPDKARSIVANAMQQARLTLADARRAIDNLRQAAPENLEAALRLEAYRFEEATGVGCALHIAELPDLPEVTREIASRAIAEALTNIASHAQARQASVRLSAAPTALQIEIEDDGAGFDPGQVPSGHYGLIGMGERIRLVGGTLEINSRPGAGSRLRISLPLQPEAV